MKPSGKYYYKYMLVYVDKIVHLSHDLKKDIYDLNCTYILKEKSIGPPKKCLGYNSKKVHIDIGKECW